MATGGSAAEDRFFHLATVYSLSEAAVLQSFLGAYRVPGYAANRATIAANSNWMVALGGIELRIHPGAAKDAIELLGAAEGGWKPPPLPYDHQWLVNAVLTLLLGFFCLVAPPPRIDGFYRWHVGPAGDDS